MKFFRRIFFQPHFFIISIFSVVGALQAQPWKQWKKHQPVQKDIDNDILGIKDPFVGSFKNPPTEGDRLGSLGLKLVSQVGKYLGNVPIVGSSSSKSDAAYHQRFMLLEFDPAIFDKALFPKELEIEISNKSIPIDLNNKGLA
jgi:hypothetical protein